MSRRTAALQNLYETLLDEYYLYEMLEKVADVLPVTSEGWEELIKARRKKELSKEEIIKIFQSNVDMDEYWSNPDNHLGCYSYPNCDLGVGGCSASMEDGVEEYGHRD